MGATKGGAGWEMQVFRRRRSRRAPRADHNLHHARSDTSRLRRLLRHYRAHGESPVCVAMPSRTHRANRASMPAIRYTLRSRAHKYWFYVASYGVIAEGR